MDIKLGKLLKKSIQKLNFYVNKCGFKIVEYLSEKYHNPDEEGLPGGEDFFRFEKIMR